MSRLGKSVLALCLFLCVQAPALAQLRADAARGELLYATHCKACHTTQIHWRDKRLVSNWNSLKAQVRRWQASIGLEWSEDEIADVARYLNAAYYGFPATEHKTLLEREGKQQALRKE